MNNRLTSYQLQDFAEEDGNSVFSDPDYVVASPLLLFPDEEESIKVNFLMMLFCLDGNLCLNFDDRKIELFAGDLLLVPPNVIVHSIRIFLAQFLNCNVSTDPFSVLDFHTSLQNGVDIVIETLLWQTVVRDAVAEHAAQFREHFKNGGLMSHELQIISCA